MKYILKMITIETKEFLEIIKGIKYGVYEKTAHFFSILIYKHRSITTNKEVIASLTKTKTPNKQISKIKGFL